MDLNKIVRYGTNGYINLEKIKTLVNTTVRIANGESPKSDFQVLPKRTSSEKIALAFDSYSRQQINFTGVFAGQGLVEYVR